MASIWKHLQVAIVGKHNDLGQGEKEKLEVTDLSDTSRRYINGLADTPDSWEFEFQYQSSSDSSFYLLKQAMDDGEVHQFAIQFTDGLKFAFGAYVNIMLNGASVGESLKFKASLTPNTAITITVPTFS